ncbi:hypothetical protein TNIN_206341 [Trichonephila inaurata madagascariensis]|uniref:Uncharacterized protein n=1 Tax=Trichonephila inaurata madagascariensis TaxID=2747483 RepID=A0A8X6XI07_9ARAC|nr:hypothetical protein TNIN_206341 [Trichonephila inaurata madagascariensis]
MYYAPGSEKAFLIPWWAGALGGCHLPEAGWNLDNCRIPKVTNKKKKISAIEKFQEIQDFIHLQNSRIKPTQERKSEAEENFKMCLWRKRRLTT